VSAQAREGFGKSLKAYSSKNVSTFTVGKKARNPRIGTKIVTRTSCHVRILYL